MSLDSHFEFVLYNIQKFMYVYWKFLVTDMSSKCKRLSTFNTHWPLSLRYEFSHLYSEAPTTTHDGKRHVHTSESSLLAVSLSWGRSFTLPTLDHICMGSTTFERNMLCYLPSAFWSTWYPFVRSDSIGMWSLLLAISNIAPFAGSFKTLRWFIMESLSLCCGENS